MAKHLLDSDILVLALRGHANVLDLLDMLRSQGEVCISVATRAEIVAGVRPHEEQRTMALLDSLVNLPITASIADHAGRLIHRYAEENISLVEALIAATALQHDLTLITTNAQRFPMLEGQVMSL